MAHGRSGNEHLRAVPLFAACTDKELALIAGAATELRFRAGEVLAREGHAGHEFVVIVEGEARIDIGGAAVATIGPGGFFGEIALLDGGARTATLTATTDVIAEVIGQQEFAGVLDGAPHLARNLLVGIARRLREADVTLSRLEQRSAPMASTTPS